MKICLKREWRKLYNDKFIICTLHQILLGRSDQGGLEGQNMGNA